MKKVIASALVLLMALVCIPLAACSKYQEQTTSAVTTTADKCTECSKESDTMLTTDDNVALCKECFDTCTQACVVCNKTVYYHAFIENANYCNECFNNKYLGEVENESACDLCGKEPIHYTTLDRVDLCKDCFENTDNCQRCENCKEYAYNFSVTEGKSYCNNCYHNLFE